MSTLLREKRRERRDFLIHELQRYGYFKTPDEKELTELNLSDLEQIHINVKCQFGKEMSRGD